MSTEPQRGPGLGDLEKELTCSICTDLLYQPLTLLDCLHTFCGSCLKEWFYTQASRKSPSPSSSSTRYTCPSCRANVRETRPNATVTTLLDMVLTANPERAKPAAEREEIERRYKHGESIFPRLASPGNSSAESDEEDQRILEEARQLSLRETRSRTRTATHRTQHPSLTPRTESADPNGQRQDGRSRRRPEEERAARRQRTTNRQTAIRLPENTTERTRRVEHQSSLRSLLSLSDTETMEEEILRQIFEEGLLDDIDLDNLDPGQEEELSERIADAYRRRHMLRSHSQRRQEAPEQSPMTRQSHARSQSMQRAQITTPQETPSSPSTTRPSRLELPVSRPGLSNHQRRLSEQGGNRRRRTSPVSYNNPASSSDVTFGPAVRSSSDVIPNRPRNSHQPTNSAASRSRRATSSEQSIPNILIGSDRSNIAPSHTRTRSPIDPPTVATSAARSSLESFSIRPRNGASEAPTSSSVVAEVNGPSTQDSRPRPSSSRSNALTQPANTYPEPSISCDRCRKLNIQYDLHKTCAQCKDGNYYICLRCYRLGRGCLEWKGFEASAQAEFERMRASWRGQPSQPQEDQHVLQSFKYSRPTETAYRFTRDGKHMTSDNPARRLQQGLFCDRCQSSANDCLWKCNRCNEGDWGFCNRCTNQGKCCTHALLPICRVRLSSRMLQDRTSSDRDTEEFKILTISTRCDICTNPIPTSTLRFHCLKCNDGDYDVCANCYLKLVATARIRKEDGINGWRRCLKGHRMAVVGFEDYPEGQRRVIVRNLVGGHALKDKHLPPTPSPTQNGPNFTGTPSSEIGDWSWKEGPERRKKASRIRSSYSTNNDRTPYSDPSSPSSNAGQTQSPTSTTTPASSRRFPPDGGVGLVVHARWSWYPEEGVRDELMFPRGAEITEAENINDDWYWGCYAGMTGLFPGSHVSVVGEIV